MIKRIKKCSDDSKADFIVVEIGGTVGEYQNEIFYMAGRNMKTKGEKVFFVHVGYLPVPKSLGEMKTKPVQQSVEQLCRMGIQPDMIVFRSDYPIDDERREKIETFCNVGRDYVISNPDLKNIYELPLIFEQQNLGNKILKNFDPALSEWNNMVNNKFDRIWDCGNSKWIYTK